MAAPECDPLRVRVAALAVFDDRVVLVRHRKGESVYHLLPGGGVRRRETLGQALVREMAEETGLRVLIGRPLIINDTIDPTGKRHVVNITFEVKITGGQLTRTSSDPRVEGVDHVTVAELLTLDLRPPIARELAEALTHPQLYRAVYLGSLFVPD